MKPIALIFLSSVMALSVSAQNPTATNPEKADDKSGQQTFRINVDVPEVYLPFTVADKKGHLLTNLKKDDFKVYEDNKLQTVSYFGAEEDLPLTIALIIDASASIRDQLQFEQEAASQFFYETLRHGTDKAFVIGFDTTANLHQDLTDDPELLSKAVMKIRSSGGTALYDAIENAITARLAKSDSRRVVILISDGDDNSSTTTIDDMLGLAQKFNVTIYSISTNSLAYFGSRAQIRGDDTLKRVSSETGGRPVFPGKLDDLHDSFQQIAEELRHQYRITYVSKNLKRDGSFRKIRIEVSNPEYKVNARKGYYARTAEPPGR